ncbi:MAG: ABC transporter permease [Bacillota bacterium]
MIGMAYRQWRLFLGSPHNVVVPLLEPTLYLLIFGQVMASVVREATYAGGRVQYLSFMLPGILAMAAWHRGVHAGTPIYVDRVTGELEALFAQPVPRWFIPVFNILSVVGQTVLYTAAVLGVGKAMGVTAVYTGPKLVFIFAEVVAFTWAVGMTFSALCALIKSQEAFNIVMNLLILPLVLTSSAFYPLEAAPAWVRTVAAGNPISIAAEGLRAVLLGGNVLSQRVLFPAGLSLVWALGASLLGSLVISRAVR